MGDKKKRFKDTKVGGWLSDKAPKILDVVGDALPDSGVLGIVKNLIDKDESLSPEEKKEAYGMMSELFKIEAEDRDSARNREIEVSKTGRFDFMFNLTGLIGLGSFCFIIYAAVFLTVPVENKEIWIHMIGICEGISISIFGYFFGSAVKKNVHP